MSKKPYVCMLCGKHYGGLLVNVTDLETKTCRKCKKRLLDGETAFHSKELNKTVWVNKNGPIAPEYKGSIFIINTEQYEKMVGKKE